MRAAVAQIGEGWRALRALGRLSAELLAHALRRGPRLPPGNMGSGMFARFGDHRYYLRQFRRHGPVFRVVWSEQVTICVVGFKRAKRLFSRHARLLLPLTVNLEPFVPHGFMRAMSPNAHPRYRRLFRSALDDGLLNAWETEFRDGVRADLDRLAASTESERAFGARALSASLDRIAGRGLLMLLYGVRPGHPTFEAFERAYQRFGPAEFEGNTLNAAQREAFDAICALIRQTVLVIGATPAAAEGDGALGRMVASDPSAADETVVGNLAFMGAQGRYDLCGLMHWVLKYLSGAPAVIAELRAALDSGDRAGARAQAERIVLETLRLDQAEALNRRVLEDFEFEGYLVPRGSFLRVLTRESHQDPETFANPEAFTPCRFAGQSYSSDLYAPFGVGEHQCLAGTIVVRLAGWMVEELVRGFTWTVEGDGERVFGRYHWQPARSFAIVLTSRADSSPLESGSARAGRVLTTHPHATRVARWHRATRDE
jgi:cytochrome P450